jgi:hypothetical protein
MFQLYVKGGDRLARVIVEILRNPSTFCLLRGEKAVHQLACGGFFVADRLEQTGPLDGYGKFVPQGFKHVEIAFCQRTIRWEQEIEDAHGHLMLRDQRDRCVPMFPRDPRDSLLEPQTFDHVHRLGQAPFSEHLDAPAISIHAVFPGDREGWGEIDVGRKRRCSGRGIIKEDPPRFGLGELDQSG